jgi:histidine triad (HIT) family protein
VPRAQRTTSIAGQSGAVWRALDCIRDTSTFRRNQVLNDTAKPEEMMPVYDHNNIFAKILRGELPCHKVFEDDRSLAFLDIMPRAPGHTLVLPKSPARNILDIAPDDLAYVMQVAQKIARASLTVFGADGVTIQQFNESSGGQVVFHLHVHVIPRQEGVPLKPPASFKEAPEVLAEQARKLSAALAR